jgi:pyruvate dehydrogenase E2 component (dihydrolipoamide acetyltransferase)
VLFVKAFVPFVSNDQKSIGVNAVATQIVVPTLGEAISEATLVRWLLNEGDPVRRGDVIAELETAKANLDIECPANGVLLSILVQAGEIVTPGQVLALAGKVGEQGNGDQEHRRGVGEKGNRGEAIKSIAAVESVPGEQGSEGAEEQRGRVSPAARRMARELGIDLSKVTASKAGARITTEDVERYIQADGNKEHHDDMQTSPAEHPQAARTPGLPFRRIELSRIQKAVAERMVESARQVPQFSVSMDADASRLLEAKQELASQGIQASLTALLVQLTARALSRHPLLNARFDGDAVIAYETVHMAVAAATPAGLVTPVIHAAEKLSLPEIIEKLAELLPAARENRLSLDQVSQATFTLSNLGMHGVQQFVPLVNPPQSAILGVGAARPAALPTPNWGIRAAWLITLTISADHRVVDGEAAARFLASLREEIEGADVRHF